MLPRLQDIERHDSSRQESARRDSADRGEPRQLDPSVLAGALREAARHMAPFAAGPSVAVVLPCFNEEATIAQVVADFRAALPQARIVVFDNASTDRTAEQARAAGAEVVMEARRGKGNVVRRIFAEIDADIYVMADGDGTYDAAAAPRLVAALQDGKADMVVGVRANIHQEAHRRGHAFGNRLFNGVYKALFGADYADIFSGYRAFSRRFVKSFPALSQGFEIETELSVHASQMRLPVAELVLPYGKRPEGSASKLSSLRDGARILAAFLYLFKETRPALFFGFPAAVLALAALGLASPLVVTWLETGLVPRYPTAILSTGMMLLAALLGVCGLILDSLARFRAEQKRILYLAVGARQG